VTGRGVKIMERRHGRSIEQGRRHAIGRADRLYRD
jgi:hypothetical protein